MDTTEAPKNDHLVARRKKRGRPPKNAVRPTAEEPGTSPSPTPEAPPPPPQKAQKADRQVIMTVNPIADAIRQSVESGVTGVDDFMEGADNSFGVPADVPKTLIVDGNEEEVVPVWKTPKNYLAHRNHLKLIAAHKDFHAIPHGPMDPAHFDNVEGTVKKEEAILCFQVKRRAEELDRREKAELNERNKLIFGDRNPVHPQLRESIMSESVTATESRDWPDEKK